MRKSFSNEKVLLTRDRFRKENNKMLVSDVRKALGQHKVEDLRQIALELYKTIPKKLREEKDIDSLLRGPHAYKQGEKTEAPSDLPAAFLSTKAEISLFMEYAHAQYYLAPNRFVHKKDRPKWRFKVKAYIKALQNVPGASSDGPQATELLEKLYAMLCHACAYYLFNTENPFASIGIGQAEPFDAALLANLSRA